MGRSLYARSFTLARKFIHHAYLRSGSPTGRDTLVVAHFQKFMKRLRKHYGDKTIRFYQCGEYGEQCKKCSKNRMNCECPKFEPTLGRPHYHAILFNLEFADRLPWKNIRGNMVYVSDTLSKLWGKGFATTAGVSFQSAAYVARYILKKQTGDYSLERYRHVNEKTGEISQRVSEYTTMSRRPGIAAKWFAEFATDVYPDDFITLEGKRYKTPRFYDKLFKRLEDGDEYLAVVKRRRTDDAKKRAYDNTGPRLVVREIVQTEKIDRLKREEI